MTVKKNEAVVATGRIVAAADEKSRVAILNGTTAPSTPDFSCFLCSCSLLILIACSCSIRCSSIAITSTSFGSASISPLAKTSRTDKS